MKKRDALLAAAAVLLGLPACTQPPDGSDADDTGEIEDGVSGAVYTLWIHGRTVPSSTKPGDYTDFSYWGPAANAAGPNPRAVNWDGQSHVSETNYLIRQALDCFCTGNRSCIVAAHSAGDLQIGYALSLYGASPRPVTDGVPINGKCTPTGATQTGWNISDVKIAGGAAGGSELANLGYWAAEPLASDLRTSVARSMYDHNQTHGVTFHLYAGAKSKIYGPVLPGLDDSAVAYHSAGGLSSTGRFCNPGDALCDGALQLGTAASTKNGQNVPKWSHHSLAWRDDGRVKDHFTNDAWGGVVGQMRADIAAGK
jgi:hypothetical protein